MDADKVGAHAQAHADAVIRADWDAVFGDFAPEVRQALIDAGPPPGMPEQVTAAEVRRVEDAGEKAIVEIHYAGAESWVTVRSEWKDRDGRPMIVTVAPAD
jgi:hypothetical protein